MYQYPHILPSKTKILRPRALKSVCSQKERSGYYRPGLDADGDGEGDRLRRLRISFRDLGKIAESCSSGSSLKLGSPKMSLFQEPECRHV
ncbi:unnamed protein product, partial [Nesidiocoris tenuis]